MFGKSAQEAITDKLEARLAKSGSTVIDIDKL